MLVQAGSSASYYGCGDRLKRGTCGNRLLQREESAQRRILDAIELGLMSPAAELLIRKLAEHGIKELAKESSAELKLRRQRLKELEVQSERLVKFIANGSTSETAAAHLADLEQQARGERSAIAELERRDKGTQDLPTADSRTPDIGGRVFPL